MIPRSISYRPVNTVKPYDRLLQTSNERKDQMHIAEQNSRIRYILQLFYHLNPIVGPLTLLLPSCKRGEHI